MSYIFVRGLVLISIINQHSTASEQAVQTKSQRLGKSQAQHGGALMIQSGFRFHDILQYTHDNKEPEKIVVVIGQASI